VHLPRLRAGILHSYIMLPASFTYKIHNYDKFFKNLLIFNFLYFFKNGRSFEFNFICQLIVIRKLIWGILKNHRHTNNRPVYQFRKLVCILVIVISSYEEWLFRLLRYCCGNVVKALSHISIDFWMYVYWGFLIYFDDYYQEVSSFFNLE